jgi:hypothetical protein
VLEFSKFLLYFSPDLGRIFELKSHPADLVLDAVCLYESRQRNRHSR